MTSKPRPRKMTTIQDIAADLGLSAMTVSRALNNHPDVKDETRERVRVRAQELNYRPNRWARSLVTRRSQIIGVVIPEILHTFFAEIIDGVQHGLGDRGYTLVLCHSGGDLENEMREIDMLVGSRAEGLIVASCRDLTDPSAFVELKQEGLPFVLIDRYFPEFDCPRVRTDDALATQLCVNRMIELGHRRIAFVEGPAVSAAAFRLEGYRTAMRAAGLEVPEEYVEQGGFSAEEGLEAGRKLLALDRPPTAIAAVNDPCGMGVIQAARERGLRVPNDLSVTGVGCVESAYLPMPFMTTTEWSREEMGRLAAKMLLALIDGEKLPDNEAIVTPQLIERMSTAPPSED